MHFFVLTLLAIAVVSAVPAANPNGSLRSPWLRQKRESNKNTEQNCEPLKLFYKFCNTCVCSADGKNATCTNDECIEGVYNEDGTYKPYDPNVKHSCIPGQHFTVNCNNCWCDFNGITAGCTIDTCDEVTCEPNKVTRNGCNECTCSATGNQLTCLEKYCSDESD